jgi:hypothetical protein
MAKNAECRSAAIQNQPDHTSALIDDNNVQQRDDRVGGSSDVGEEQKAQKRSAGDTSGFRNEDSVPIPQLDLPSTPPGSPPVSMREPTLVTATPNECQCVVPSVVVEGHLVVVGRLVEEGAECWGHTDQLEPQQVGQTDQVIGDAVPQVSNDGDGNAEDDALVEEGGENGGQMKMLMSPLFILAVALFFAIVAPWGTEAPKSGTQVFGAHNTTSPRRLIFMGHGEPTSPDVCAATQWADENSPHSLLTTHIYTDAGSNAPAETRQYRRCSPDRPGEVLTYHSTSTNISVYDEIVLILDVSDLARDQRNVLTSRAHKTLLKNRYAKQSGPGRWSIVFKATNQRVLCGAMERTLRDNQCGIHETKLDIAFADDRCDSDTEALKRTMERYAATVGRSKGAPSDALYYAMLADQPLKLSGTTALMARPVGNRADPVLDAGSAHIAAILQPSEHADFVSKVETAMGQPPLADFDDEFKTWNEERSRWFPRIPFLNSIDERAQRKIDWESERRNQIQRVCPHYNVGVLGLHGAGKSTTIRWASLYGGSSFNYLKQMSVARRGGKTQTLALNKYNYGNSTAVRLWDTKGIRPEWLKGNATDVVAKFVMPMVEGRVKDGCELHGETNYDWENNEADSLACQSSNGDIAGWRGWWSSFLPSFLSSSAPLNNHEHEFENKLNVVLYVTRYLDDLDERDRTEKFLAELLAQLRVTGIELVVVVTSMEHCSKILECCQQDMQVMLNNVGIGTEGSIFIPRGNWTHTSTPLYQAVSGCRKDPASSAVGQTCAFEDTYTATAGSFLQPDSIHDLIKMIRHKGYLWCAKYEKYVANNMDEATQIRKFGGALPEKPLGLVFLGPVPTCIFACFCFYKWIS